MKRILLPLMAMSIALTSCSRDNDDVTNPIVNPVAQAKKLVGLTRVYGVQGAAPITGATFEYNGDKLNKFVIWGHAFLHYDGDRVSSLEMIDGPDAQKVEFVYNANGTLKSSIQKFESSEVEFSRDYTYISPTTIKVKEIMKYTRNSSETEREYTLTTDGENLIKKEMLDRSNNRTETIQYRYDDKKNPLRELKGLSALSLELELLRMSRNATARNYIRTFKNNVISEETTTDNQLIAKSTYQYNYNQDNLPTKVLQIVNSYTNGYGTDWEDKFEFIYNYQ